MQALGLELWARYVQAALSGKTSGSEHNKTAVSVGSGRAVHEQDLLRRIDCLSDIICVDPHPDQFESQAVVTHIKPSFNSVQELAAARPEVVCGATPLILDWPYPNSQADFNDLRAISALLPPTVVMCIDSSGGAGSSACLAWLQTLDGMDDFAVRGDFGFVESDAETAAVPVPSRQYRVAKSTFLISRGRMGDNIFRFILLARDDVTLDQAALDAMPNNLGSLTEATGGCGVQ